MGAVDPPAAPDEAATGIGPESRDPITSSPLDTGALLPVAGAGADLRIQTALRREQWSHNRPAQGELATNHVFLAPSSHEMSSVCMTRSCSIVGSSCMPAKLTQRSQSTGRVPTQEQEKLIIPHISHAGLRLSRMDGEEKRPRNPHGTALTIGF